MTKVKRSFFEKITGAKRVDDNIYEREGAINPPSRFYEEERREAFISPEVPPAAPMPPRNESFPVQDENEGQLTIDVYQTENDIVIKSTIAGVKPEDLDVSINNDMITIRGERRQDEQISSENYYYQECYWGGFSRSVILPVDVLPEKIEASMKNGILTVRLPKADTTRTKKIQVRGF
ncbi:MAG TPA: Hsp20/alpha crystallin family protein [Candidatus Moranbacteria bacterium]|nr:Hsp20/alpha crystallin family protein [Candidatus Moranbacteria bacterium]